MKKQTLAVAKKQVQKKQTLAARILELEAENRRVLNENQSLRMLLNWERQMKESYKAEVAKLTFKAGPPPELATAKRECLAGLRRSKSE